MAKRSRRAGHGRVLAGGVVVAAVAAATTIWTAHAGLSDSAEERPAAPKRPAAVSPAIAHASDAGPRGVNITIDDGPDPRWTPEVLEVLAEHKVKATFCVVGPQAEAHPDLVKAIVAAGHRLCDHSVEHDTTMDTKSKSYQAQQIVDAEKSITRASGGVRPLYYRAPGGAFTPYSRQLAASHGMRPLGWNVDTKDFERPGADAIVKTVKEQIAGGPTLLFHDAGGDRSQTVEALREILPWLKDQGYVFGFPER
ncbi:polysaccharide deacetylase family protein [Streptomyces sp. NA04227]|uniref:polysaccharide deacetylase family protein n=1 Tax=Streptomyces sp. NA04227 TaxID=2742136 RepID=UPI001591D2BA|nr:polysaccharide deacetylase family protein [Streptomyces sp. NA04227]QKW09719.1 polysaccharide deacetylase family protein [Streptomyces sp. NA04227]